MRVPVLLLASSKTEKTLRVPISSPILWDPNYIPPGLEPQQPAGHSPALTINSLKLKLHTHIYIYIEYIYICTHIYVYKKLESSLWAIQRKCVIQIKWKNKYTLCTGKLLCKGGTLQVKYFFFLKLSVNKAKAMFSVSPSSFTHQHSCHIQCSQQEGRQETLLARLPL